MSKQILNSLFMFSPLAESDGFYQELLKGVASYHQLSNKLIHTAEVAHAFRQYDKLRKVGLLLSNLPLKEYRIIGQYYFALSMSENGFTDIETAERIFESVVSLGPKEYKSKALLMLSAIAAIKQDFPSAFEHYFETIKLGHDSSGIQALRGIAVLKAYEGYHKSALKDLENIYPLARLASPHIHFAYLNSLAVELSETGRLEEARNISRIAVASPFGSMYPEWRETYSEVNQRLYKSRSSVTVSQPKKEQEIRKAKPKSNVLKFPTAEKLSSEEVISEMRKLNVSLTPLQLLGVMMKAMFKDRIKDEEIDKLCTIYYETIKAWYS